MLVKKLLRKMEKILTKQFKTQSRIGSPIIRRTLRRLHPYQYPSQKRSPLKLELPQSLSLKLKKRRRKRKSPNLQRRVRRKKRERKLVATKISQKMKKLRLFNQSAT